MKKILSAVLLFALTFGAMAQTRGLPDFTELVEKHGAAVVNISTTQVTKGRS